MFFTEGLYINVNIFKSFETVKKAAKNIKVFHSLII